MDEVKKRIEAGYGQLIPVISSNTDGPARRYRIAGAGGEVGFISAMSRHFCASCNRIRMTAQGQIRPCLLDDNSVDIKTSLRNGSDDSVLTDIICEAVSIKGLVHDTMPKVSARMMSIGG
jgi:cyclic pyranopterin phosphate synthase